MLLLLPLSLSFPIVCTFRLFFLFSLQFWRVTKIRNSFKSTIFKYENKGKYALFPLSISEFHSWGKKSFHLFLNFTPSYILQQISIFVIHNKACRLTHSYTVHITISLLGWIRFLVDLLLRDLVSVFKWLKCTSISQNDKKVSQITYRYSVV